MNSKLNQIKKEVNKYRLLLLITVIAYPSIGYINTFVNFSESNDNFIQRIIFAAAIVISLILSYLNTYIFNHFYKIIKVFVYIGYSHLLLIGALNGYSFTHFLGLLVVFISTSFVFKYSQDLIKYVYYSIICFIISIYFAPSTEIDKIIATILLSTIVVVRFVAFKLSEKNQNIILSKDANIQSVIDNVEGMIWSIDIEYKLIAFNKAFEIALNEVKNTIIHPGISILNENIISFTGSEFRKYYLTAFDGEKISVEKEFFINEETKLFQFFFTPIKIEGSAKIIGITIFGRDITQERIREKELIESKNQTELIAKSKEEFLANMSHEIRTPLNGIIGFTKILLQNPKIEEDELSQLNIIKRSSDILLVLINDILDISKIDSGKITLEEIDININEIITHIIENFKQKIESKNIKIQINSLIQDDIIFIADPVRISQILLNLISNSLKFTPDNGDICISVKHKEINSNEVTLYFEIKDSGIGIPEDKLESIFDPFTQSGIDTTRKYGGTGLGLSIVKKFIELMNGTIWIESEIGKGSNFHFNINVKMKENTVLIGEEENTIHSNNQQLKNEEINILVAEDNNINQLLIQAVLTEFQFQFSICKDGREAVERYKNEKFHIILMDLMMPVLNGYDASSEIREYEIKKNLSKIPIIALSADVTSSGISKLNEYGINDYLSKPFESNDLYSKIYKLISFNKNQ